MELLIKTGGRGSIATNPCSPFGRLDCARAHIATDADGRSGYSKVAMCNQQIGVGDCLGNEWGVFDIEVSVSPNGTILQNEVVIVREDGVEKKVYLCDSCKERYYKSLLRQQKKEQWQSRREELAKVDKDRLERWLQGL